MTDFQGFYEAGLSVEIYDTMFDEEFTQQLGDVRFYSEYAKKDSLIIELGSGTGRVSCALAELGYKVLGIENSDAMLNIANAKRKGLKQKGAKFIKADMKSFSVKIPASLIIIPFRSFEMLLDVEDQIACLNNISKHLDQQGKLIIHITYPNSEQLKPGLRKPDKSWCSQVPHPKTGNRVLMDAKSINNNVVNQVSREIWKFKEFSDDEDVLRLETREIIWRWTNPPELKSMLENNGFTVLEHYSDFNRNHLMYGGQQIIVADKL